jgi:hypothetical protein
MRTMLASITDAVTIRIFLICISDTRAVIGPIWNPIAIGIYELAAFNDLIESHLLLVG